MDCGRCDRRDVVTARARVRCATPRLHASSPGLGAGFVTVRRRRVVVFGAARVRDGTAALAAEGFDRGLRAAVAFLGAGAGALAASGSALPLLDTSAAAEVDAVFSGLEAFDTSLSGLEAFGAA